MSEPDDWAPLPPDQLAQHPGEFGTGRPEFTLSVPPPADADEPAEPPPVQMPVPRVAPRNDDPAADAALLALKHKLAQTPPPASLVSAVQRREEREERRQRALQRPTVAAATASPAVPTATPPSPPVATGLTIGNGEVDPREREPWFGDLPRGEQERLRAVWWQQRHRYDGHGGERQKRFARAACFGGGIFFAMGLFQALLAGGLAIVPMLTLAGAVAAVIAELCGGGRFVYGIAGGLAFAVGMGPMVFVQPLLLSNLLMAAYGMGLVGMDGEMRRSGGFGER